MKEMYENPDGKESMRDLCAIGDKNWRDYCSEEVDNMTGHLMTYPIQVQYHLVKGHSFTPTPEHQEKSLDTNKCRQLSTLLGVTSCDNEPFDGDRGIHYIEMATVSHLHMP